MELFEWFKGVGAFIGILTGASVVWDKIAKETPVCYLRADALYPNSSNKRVYLAVQNRSNWPLLICWEGGSERNPLSLSAGSDTRAIVTALVKGKITVVVPGNNSVDLALLKTSTFAGLPGEAKIKLKVRWKYVQRSLWPFRRGLSATITKSDFLQLLDEKDSIVD